MKATFIAVPTPARLALKVIGFFLIIVLCLLAQAQFLAPVSPVIAANGYLFLGAAGILALLLIAPVSSPAFEPSATLDAPSGLSRWFGAILLIIGLVFVARAASTFHTQLLVTQNPDGYPWILYAVGLGISLLGGLLFVGIGRLPRPDLTILLLLAVLALAIFVRVYQVDQYPFGVWYDEAIYGLHVNHWLVDPTFRPIFVDNITFPHLILDVWAVQIFGTANVAGLRLISALLGSAGVILAYLVGRELRGRWFGLAMAFLLAALRWSIDFSRIGMIGPEVVTFMLLTFFAAFRLVRSGRLRDAFWFGLALGAGLYGYSPYQLQILAVAVYLLIAYPFRRRAWWRTAALVVTALVALVVILTPLLVFIVDHSDRYFDRINNVSVFSEDRAPDQTVADLIETSTIQHLEMFHLNGDRNGRHNLPGAPELDPVTGSLMIIGLFVALRERRRVHLLFALSIVIALLGGIFSVSFEAPQSLRSIGAITGVIYFSALGLDGMIRLAAACLAALSRIRLAVTYRVAGVGALAALGLMAAWNFNIYFNLQRTDLSVWNSYSTTDALTGRSYANYPDTTQFFASPLIGNSPTVQFLAPTQLDRSTILVMPDPLPIRIAPTSQAVIMLVPMEDFYMPYLSKLYPNAHIQPIRPIDYGVNDSENDVLFTVIELTAQDVGAIQGLHDGRGVLYVPVYDRYTFTFASNVQLKLDGTAVTSGTPLQLAQGNHAITVTPSDAALTWQYAQSPDGDPNTSQPVPPYLFYHDPVMPNGLVASFYNNADWQGEPVNKEVLPFVYWFIQIVPMDRPYSVRYDGYLYAPVTGEYTLRLDAIDTAAFDLDGKNVLTTVAPDQPVEAKITLTQGWHPVETRHQDITGGSRIFLNWITPDQTTYSPISRDYFCPTADLCATPASLSPNP